MKLKYTTLLFSLAFLMLGVSCGAAAAPLPTYTPYPTYAPLPILTPEVIIKEVVVTATPTSAPTATPVPTPTPVPKATTVTPVPNIQILNHSSFSTKDIEKWIALAESKMKSRESRIFAFIYPVGKMKKPEKRIRSDYGDRVYREHEVLLSKDEKSRI